MAPESSLPFEISPQEVYRRKEGGEAFYFIDVREPQEHQLAHIEGGQLMPMRSVPENLPALEEAADTAPIIVFCHHGQRSLNVVAWLRQHGVETCQSMAGGIDRWSVEIDPTVPRY